MIHASLFSGIGGPEVAAAMLGWKNAFHCEINPFGRQVLEYWFPDSVSYEDITKTSFKEWRGRIDVLTGGFPCQPFSYAGKRGGREDERYLWPEMLRAIDEIRPTWVVGENVAGLATMVEGWLLAEMGGGSALFEEDKHVYEWNLEQTFTIEKIAKELEELGYSVQPVLIPAAAVGAPHRRDRIFLLAHDDSNPADAGSESERGRQAEIHSPGSASDANGRRSGEVQTPVHPGIADGDVSICGGRKRNAPDSGSRRLERSCEGRREGAGNDAMRSDRIGSEKRYAADSNGSRFQESKQPGRAAPGKEKGAGLDDRTLRSGRDETIADAFCKRLSAAVQSRIYGAEERDDARRSVMFYSNDAWLEGTWWNSFPTVSPVHRGNDGIPFYVDGLAVPPMPAPPTYGKSNPKKYPFGKWRTESLKAYGNAIVPQVMYRIFQAIEKV